MNTYTVGAFKANFSEILEKVRSGERIAITFGKKKIIVAYLTPVSVPKMTKRPLGLLAGRARVVFKDDFSITESDFLG